MGDARVSGLELDYRQNLTFLPRWARGVTLFGNITWQDLEGSEQASFAGFARKMANWGISLNRQRFAVRLAVNHRGLIQQNLITQAGAEAGTYQYLLPRTSADFTAEYRLTEHFGLYVSGRNINKEVDYTVRYGPSTPRDRIVVGRAGYGAPGMSASREPFNLTVMNRRRFLQSSLAATALAGVAPRLFSASRPSGRPPRVLLRNSWQA